MDNIRIVEYEPSLAKGIAEMWNNSSDGWNGNVTFRTEHSVKQSEANSAHLNLFIATDGDLVVGYCKLSKYDYDDNTLYIDLLSVLPTYHGKKVGKRLVLKALEKTIELGWPRLDLFTWDGNTKAVPLYKKTGFFWEKLEANATHLMNFIPTVLKTEILSDYFTKAHWYNDSVRKIEIAPDGKKDNNFDYYTYSWKKEKNYLEVDFEKSGRGISRIDNNDYSIRTIIEDNKLVFGSKYQVNYEIINKTAKPLNIEIKGLNNKNIVFDFDFKKTISGKEVIKAEFYLDKIDKAQDSWTTHPTVQAEIIINGKKAIFKTGINPKFPLVIHLMNGLINENEEHKQVINVENNYPFECEFTVGLPESEIISFAEKELHFSLKAKEKSSIFIMIRLKKGIVLETEVPITVRFPNGESMHYNQSISLIKTTYNSIGYGNTKEILFMNNGKNMMWVGKERNWNETYYQNQINNLWVRIHYPKLGNPASSEFHYRGTEQYEFSEEHGNVLLKMIYESQDYKGCRFAVNYRLNASGIFEYFIELLDFPEDKDEIKISYSFGFSKSKMQMLYDGQLVSLDSKLYNDIDMSYWNMDKIQENWIFNQEDNSNLAIIWDKEHKITMAINNFTIEETFLKNGSLVSKPLKLAIDYFYNINSVRSFALNKEVKPLKPQKSLDLQVNHNNPFTDKLVSLTYIDLKEKEIEGTLQIESLFKGIEKQVRTVETTDHLHEIGFELKIKNRSPLQIIKSRMQFKTNEIIFEKAFFIKNKHQISKSREVHETKPCLVVKNGIIEMKSSQDFAPSLFSLKYKDQEWLDSNYPEKGCKSWWNPWLGGIMMYPSNIKESFLLEEASSTEFVSKTDESGNKWQGIVVTTPFLKYDFYKGLTIRQYYLMLPGVPVLACYSELEQNGGFETYINTKTDIFVKVGEDIKEGLIEYEYEGKRLKYLCGIEDVSCNHKTNLLIFRGKQRKETMFVYNSDYINNAYISTSLSVIYGMFNANKKLESIDKQCNNPKFIIFSEQELKESHLEDLKYIRFK